MGSSASLPKHAKAEAVVVRAGSKQASLASGSQGGRIGSDPSGIQEACGIGYTPELVEDFSARLAELADPRRLSFLEEEVARLAAENSALLADLRASGAVGPAHVGSGNMSGELHSAAVESPTRSRRPLSSPTAIIWEKALAQKPHLATLGEPVAVETQVLSGTVYYFIFSDATKVGVFERSWTDTLEVSEAQQLGASACTFPSTSSGILELPAPVPAIRGAPAPSTRFRVVAPKDPGKANLPGIAFRSSMHLENKTGQGVIARWGSIIAGVDRGTDWIEVTNADNPQHVGLYLPISIQGDIVLEPAPNSWSRTELNPPRLGSFHATANAPPVHVPQTASFAPTPPRSPLEATIPKMLVTSAWTLAEAVPTFHATRMPHPAVGTPPHTRFSPLARVPTPVAPALAKDVDALETLTRELQVLFDKRKH